MLEQNLKLGLILLVTFALLAKVIEKHGAARPSAGPHAAIRRHVNWWFTWVFLAMGAPLLWWRKRWVPESGPVFGPADWAGPRWLNVAVALLVVDFAAYAVHFLMHKTRVGWSFHRVHHSDTHVDFSTSFRQHPIETLWRFVFQSAALWLVSMPSAERAALGVFVALHSQLHHLNFVYPQWIDRAVGWVLVTPHQHRIHHSRDVRETDTNYGTFFSFWDRAFGTFHWTDPRAIRYGLDEFDLPERQRFGFLLRHRAIDRALESRVQGAGVGVSPSRASEAPAGASAGASSS